jgi:hypothetical protein
MATLHELRKFGGFADLEQRERKVANVQSDDDTHFGSVLRTDEHVGSAEVRPDASRAMMRGHPSLLLDIIETMMLVKSDPDSEVLRDKLQSSATLSVDQLVADSEPVRVICIELDDAIKSAENALAVARKMLRAATFVLARADKLRAVGAYIKPRRHSSRNRDGGSGAKALCVDSPLADIIAARHSRIQELCQEVLPLFSAAALTSGVSISIEDKPPPPCATLSEIEQLIEEHSKATTEVSAVDSHLRKSILVARIAQLIEAYVNSLKEYVKKIKDGLDLVFAQCAVLMSSRAVIA